MSPTKDGTNTQAVIEPDTHDDGDSVLTQDAIPSTASLTASILEYRTIHGRTFHSQRGPGNAEYWAPNDDQHNTSMDIQHHVWTLLLDGKLHLAPLPERVGKVLDVGTGTGIWAIDFADENPEAVVVGVDLSPTQLDWVPPNCRFEIDDVSLRWTWPENEFDFVYLRTMFGSFKDWQHVFNEAYREIGSYDQAAVEEGLEGYVVYMFTDILGWSMDEVQLYLSKVRKELRDKRHHTYFWTRTVYGRKPAVGETSGQ
ncbi:hypothetical protein NCS56_01518800 [Fusarium sp. Ph1]|nr:hypothetical protein NCS56_01518800 [Fusarium sp. Ph1]